MRLLLISLFIFLGLNSYANANWQMAAGSIFNYEKYNSEEIKESRRNAFQLGYEFEEWLGRFEYSQFHDRTGEGVVSIQEDTQNYIYWSDFRIKNWFTVVEPFVGFGLGIKKSTVVQKIYQDSSASDGYENLYGLNVGLNGNVTQKIFISGEARIYKETRRYSQTSFYLGLGFKI